MISCPIRMICDHLRYIVFGTSHEDHQHWYFYTNQQKTNKLWMDWPFQDPEAGIAFLCFCVKAPEDASAYLKILPPKDNIQQHTIHCHSKWIHEKKHISQHNSSLPLESIQVSIFGWKKKSGKFMKIIYLCFPSWLDDQDLDPPLPGAWTRPERFVSPAVDTDRHPEQRNSHEERWPSSRTTCMMCISCNWCLQFQILTHRRSNNETQ